MVILSPPLIIPHLNSFALLYFLTWGRAFTAHQAQLFCGAQRAGLSALGLCLRLQIGNSRGAIVNANSTYQVLWKAVRSPSSVSPTNITECNYIGLS